LGKHTVKDIVFRVGKVEKGRMNEKTANGQGDSEKSRDDYIRRLHGVQLDQYEVTRIDEMVAQIEDEDIRDSLRELFISQSKLNKFRDHKG
jgi:hypothetical protein